MFGRLKQNIREKTGRAQATKLPDEIEAKIAYCADWEKRDKTLIKAFSECVDPWKKCSKQTDMEKTLAELESVEGGMAEGAKQLRDHLNTRIEREKKGHEEVNKFEAKMKMFFSSELRAMNASISLLKKKRTTRDGLAHSVEKKPTEENQRKFDAAEAEFTAQLAATTGDLSKMAEYDNTHKTALLEMMAAFEAAFDMGE